MLIFLVLQHRTPPVAVAGHGFLFRSRNNVGGIVIEVRSAALLHAPTPALLTAPMVRVEVAKVRLGVTDIVPIVLVVCKIGSLVVHWQGSVAAIIR